MIRTTRPTAGNKYFITKSAGGYSTCIVGKPTDSQCNVLSNCVGYACGAFNEELDLGYEKYHLNCNAENFIERAIASGLSVIQKPCLGAIACWEGKGTLAGHVAMVVEIIDDNTVRFAESGYGRTNPFWTSIRNNSNGRWGLTSDYPFRGFIVNPNYPYNPSPTPTPGDYPWDGIVKKGSPLYNESGKAYPNPAAADRDVIVKGEQTSTGRYQVYGESFNPNIVYVDKENVSKKTPTPTPTPTYKYKIGDKVIINGRLYGDADGGKPGKTVKNKVTNITRIAEGKPYPYNTTGDLGWMSEDCIQPYTESTSTSNEFKVGDKVVPITLVSYTGTHLIQYDPYYYITELKGDRAVLSALRDGKYYCWAAMNINNIKKI